jgi:hypothetical protein
MGVGGTGAFAIGPDGLLAGGRVDLVALDRDGLEGRDEGPLEDADVEDGCELVRMRPVDGLDGRFKGTEEAKKDGISEIFSAK